jgi:hypothetical protein
VRSWLSAIIGAAFHWATEAVVLPLVIRPVDPACKWASPLPLNHDYQIASVRFRRKLAIGAYRGSAGFQPHSFCGGLAVLADNLWGRLVSMLLAD